MTPREVMELDVSDVRADKRIINILRRHAKDLMDFRDIGRRPLKVKDVVRFSWEEIQERTGYFGPKMYEQLMTAIRNMAD